ncbi:MAG: hypothetical protein CSYNP_04184 [Syntrophus sp. SKADARSKE-3]|nr:hypothetical protein [Syntrophus sp. SKADARSKE-3]
MAIIDRDWAIFLIIFAALNLTFGIFNILPIFPASDGGLLVRVFFTPQRRLIQVWNGAGLVILTACIIFL